MQFIGNLIYLYIEGIFVQMLLFAEDISRHSRKPREDATELRQKTETDLQHENQYDQDKYFSLKQTTIKHYITINNINLKT